MATLQTLRETLVEQWLAEANSGFYTDAVENAAINWAYRTLARKMRGVEARWDADTTSTTPYEYATPRDLIFFDHATYNPNGPTGSGVKRLTPMSFDKMFASYGPEWISHGEGTPHTIFFRGIRTYGLFPPASSVVTNGVSIFGRALPDDLSGDSSTALTPTSFDDIIAIGGFIYCLRRKGMNDGEISKNFPEAYQEWQAGQVEAERWAANLRVDYRVVGGVRMGSVYDWRPRWPSGSAT